MAQPIKHDPTKPLAEQAQSLGNPTPKLEQKPKEKKSIKSKIAEMFGMNKTKEERQKEAEAAVKSFDDIQNQNITENTALYQSRAAEKKEEPKAPETEIETKTTPKPAATPVIEETKTETPAETTDIDSVITDIEDITNSDTEVGKVVDGFVDPETGEVNEKKTNSAINEYEKKLVEMGAGEYDMDGNFILKPVEEKKGWETWATIISCGLSVIGIAMGIPIMPINFKAITGRDSKNAQIQAFQQQYMNIKAGKTEAVSGMEADIEAGERALENQDALAAQEKHAQATAATKDVIGAQTKASAQLIDKQTQADLKKAQQQIDANERALVMTQKHAKEMAQLSSDLSTASSKDLLKYQKSTWLVDFIKQMKAEGYSQRDIALWLSAQAGQTPTQKGLENAEKITGMVFDGIRTAADVVNPF